MDGSYLVDERDGEMGGVRTESCDSSDAEDNDAHELGLGANLARVGSLSGKVTTVLSNGRNLHRRASSKKISGRLVAVKLTPRGAGSQRDAEKERVAFVREVEVLRVSLSIPAWLPHPCDYLGIILNGNGAQMFLAPARVAQQVPRHTTCSTLKATVLHRAPSSHVFLIYYFNAYG